MLRLLRPVLLSSSFRNCFVSTSASTLSQTRAMPKYTYDLNPPVHRGMTVLDRGAFKSSVDVQAARVLPTKVHQFTHNGVMKGEILEIPKIASIVRDPSQSETSRLVLLGCPQKESLPPAVQDFITAESQGLTTYELELDYDYWGADEILRAILPEDLLDGTPSSFTITGHIAHLNLRDEYLPYKNLIGQVILDKNRRLRTVVNKLGVIDTEFRYFKMEVIAGDDDFNVTLHESDCIFQFDFSTVYWNSRLQHEHQRLIELFKPGEVVVDMCAGVGPFAVPAAKKGCFVLGNDLNPSCAKAMQENANRNKVNPWIRVSCQDGRGFARQAVADVYSQPFEPRPVKATVRVKRSQRSPSSVDAPEVPPPLPSRRRVDHFVMNLPATAIEFLDAFHGIFSSLREDKDFEVIYGQEMPMVHCYSFTKELDPQAAAKDLRERGSKFLGTQLPEDTNYHWVRTVAPNKDMYCISFRLPHDAVFAKL